MTASYLTPKTTEENRIVLTGKFEVQVTNKKLCSRYCTICTIEAMKLTTNRHHTSRGLFATAELLVEVVTASVDMLLVRCSQVLHMWNNL